MTALFGPTDAIDRAHVPARGRRQRGLHLRGAARRCSPRWPWPPRSGPGPDDQRCDRVSRNPIHLAHQANDLQLLTEGRFTLGLGTQVRTQIEKRFGAEFDRPGRPDDGTGACAAGDLRGLELRRDGSTSAGEYYRHTLMTPTFSPGAQPVRPATDLRRRARARG